MKKEANEIYMDFLNLTEEDKQKVYHSISVERQRSTQQKFKELRYKVAIAVNNLLDEFPNVKIKVYDSEKNMNVMCDLHTLWPDDIVKGDKKHWDD